MPPVPLTLALTDATLDRKELETLTATTQSQLQKLTETIGRQPITPDVTDDPSLIRKGEETAPGILKMEVNLENITKVVSWLYQRVAGKTTKAKLSFAEGDRKVEFEFDGNSQQDLEATLIAAQEFIKTIQAKQDNPA